MLIVSLIEAISSSKVAKKLKKKSNSLLQMEMSQVGSLQFPCSTVNGEDTRWLYSSKYKTITCSGTRYNYVGPYGARESISTYFPSLQFHKGIIISFNLAFIDSWDGETFSVNADGTTVYAITHKWRTQSFSKTCQNSLWPDAYSDVRFGFNHTASTLSLKITSSLDQASSDEAWGICNFILYTSSYPVTSYGAYIY
jgi:hypothetical protein